MAKDKKSQQSEEKEMSLEEAKAYRASLYRPSVKPLSDAQKREAFRIFWASNKKKYGKSKALEKSLWLHLTAIGANSPDKFSEGLDNFGLKKVK